jgi:hypothetical protein
MLQSLTLGIACSRIRTKTQAVLKGALFEPLTLVTSDPVWCYGSILPCLDLTA